MLSHPIPHLSYVIAGGRAWHHGMVWYGVVWYGMAWQGEAKQSKDEQYF